MEAPRIEFFSKALVPAFGGGAYIGQVLYGNHYQIYGRDIQDVMGGVTGGAGVYG